MHLISSTTRAAAPPRLPAGAGPRLAYRTRLIGLCGLMLMLGSVTSAQAGLIGYPLPRETVFWPRIELTGDSFKADLKSNRKAEATTGRALATVSFGLTPWIELYARAGLAEFNIANADFKGGFGFAYGGGARLRVWELPFVKIGLLGQYLRFTSNDADSAGRAVDGEWKAYDIGLGVGTHRLGPFQFYGGATYHRVDVALTAPDGRLTLEQNIPVLAFVGLHIIPLIDFPRGEFLVNVEARFVDEIPQFTLGFQYQFGVARNRSDR
jgi:opacity protein-like surface antigen